MRIPGFLLPLGLLVALIQGAGAPLQAQTPGVLLGIVGDTTGKPLPETEIVALRARRVIKTDSRGIFTLSLLPGDETLIVRRIGSVPQTFDATMAAGDTTRIGVILAYAATGATALPDLVVEAEGVSYGGKMMGFGERLSTGGVPRGNFFTRKDIEASGLTLTADLLTRAGLKVRDDQRPERRMRANRSILICPRGTVSMRLVPRIAYFVDGIKMNDEFDINTIDISQIEAIEVYRSASQLPAQYNTTGAGCIVLLWLRGGN